MDLILNEQLDEQNFEAEEMSFAQELLTMPAFSTDKEDEDRLKTYILQRVPPMLKSELDTYLLSSWHMSWHRRRPLMARARTSTTRTTCRH